MKIKDKTTKKTPASPAGGFDAVKFMREQRDRISKDLLNLSPEEIVKYFEEKQSRNRVKASN